MVYIPPSFTTALSIQKCVFSQTKLLQFYWTDINFSTSCKQEHMNLVFATNNIHKAEEIQLIMPDGYKISTLNEIGCVQDIPETADSLEGNAALKSAYVLKYYRMDCFADDTGLEIEALNGEPGIFSARYAGQSKNSDDNMNLVLEKLKGNNNRKARFRTVISLRFQGSEHSFEGIVNGKICTEKSGKEGFGYDPIFQPEGYDCTFSEMSMEEKNRISHRGIAVQKLIDFLAKV
jgi:XTP/dITP diphosphohydrolase